MYSNPVYFYQLLNICICFSCQADDVDGQASPPILFSIFIVIAQLLSRYFYCLSKYDQPFRLLCSGCLKLVKINTTADILIVAVRSVPSSLMIARDYIVIH